MFSTFCHWYFNTCHGYKKGSSLVPRYRSGHIISLSLFIATPNFLHSSILQPQFLPFFQNPKLSQITMTTTKHKRKHHDDNTPTLAISCPPETLPPLPWLIECHGSTASNRLHRGSPRSFIGVLEETNCRQSYPITYYISKVWDRWCIWLQYFSNK